MHELVDSVFAQGYANWELVLIDASNNDESSTMIKAVAASDTRIRYHKVNNEGIAENTNAGLALAKGDYIAFLDHDDVLDPDALSENVLAIQRFQPDLIYSDEDKISDDSSYYFDPHFKPDFSLSLLRSVNYITHFVVVKNSLAKEVGFIESGFDGAQDYNFLLHIVDRTEKIYHIPKILYHWRQAIGSTASNFSNKKNITDAGEHALNNHYRRRSIAAKAKAIENRPGFYGTHFQLSSKKRAIIVLKNGLTSHEIEYIKSAYEKHHEVKKLNIDCLMVDNTNEVAGRYDEIIVATVPAYPFDSGDTSISSLFGYLSAGYDAVMPLLISRNKIVGCGYVWDKTGQLAPLFFGTDPSRAQYFGSTEWNRDVNGLDTRVICTSSDFYIKHAKQRLISDGRLAVHGQTEFLVFKGRNVRHSASQGNFYNPNLAQEMHPRLIENQLLYDAIKVKK